MDDKPSINGWTPPVIYDIANDSSRVATQEDVDRMQAALNQFSASVGQIRQAIKSLDDFYRTSRTLDKPGE